LDQVIHQNASGSEEVASTAEELLGQAEQLQSAAAFFKLTGSGAMNRTVMAVSKPRPQEPRRNRAAIQVVRERQKQLEEDGGNWAAMMPPAGNGGGHKAKGLALDMGQNHGGNGEDAEFERY
jgi:hypothetical protein